MKIATCKTLRETRTEFRDISYGIHPTKTVTPTHTHPSFPLPLGQTFSPITAHAPTLTKSSCSKGKCIVVIVVVVKAIVVVTDTINLYKERHRFAITSLYRWFLGGLEELLIPYKLPTSLYLLQAEPPSPSYL